MIRTPVTLIRRVTFSAGHRYWDASLSPEENRRQFGDFASPYNHGHNYVLTVFATGGIVEHGMVVNIKDIDELLQNSVVRSLDGKSLNDEVPELARKQTSIENLLVFLCKRIREPLEALAPGLELTRLRLEEKPDFWGDLILDGQEQMITLTRTYEFSASHRLHNPVLSEAENVDLFGKCTNPAGHGHNYVLEVTVTGEPNPSTGMVLDLTELDRIVEETVVDRYDHKNLNEDLPEFQGRITTSEVIVQEIFERLKGKLPVKLTNVKLHETARSAFEVVAS